MKIKKVEISAFRAFNKVEDATFDFTLPDDKIANLISIYAPNGYGKTSFYDAVEWCVTGQIERFHRNATEYDKLAIENRKGGNENPFFLQHHNQKDRLGSVTVFTDEKDYVKKLTKSKVYNFKNKAKNDYFKNVILSQDLIDTFIKEDKADERYKKFIDSIPYLKDYNNALQNIIKLITNINDDIIKLTGEKKNKENTQLNLDFEGDDKILEEINFAISRLIDKKQEITIIQKESFSKKKFDILTQKVNSEVTSLGFEIENLKLRIGNIDIAYNGLDTDENKKGVVEYYNLKQKSKELINHKNELNRILNSIKEKEQLEILKLDLETDLKKVIDLNNAHLKIKSDFEKYSKIESEIQRLNKKVTDLGFEKEKNKIIEQELFAKESNTKSDLTQKHNEFKSQKNRLKDFPANKIKLERISDEIKEITKYIKETEENITEKNKLIENINLKLEQNSYFKNKLKEDIEVLLDYDFFKEHKSIIKEIIELQNKKEDLDQKLIDANKDIDAQDDLNKELKEFLSRGLELVAKNESRTCPLCSQHYDSHTELSNKISNNKLLSKILKRSLAEKSSLEIECKNNNTIILSKVKLLEVVINDSTLPSEIEKIKISKNLKELKVNLEKKIELLNVLEKEKLSLASFFGGFDNNSFEKNIKNELLDFEKIINEFTISLNKIEKEKENNKSLINKLDKEILFLTNEIEKEKKSNIYNKICNYYNEILKSNTIDLSNLEDEITKNEKIVLELKLKVEENTKAIKAIKKSLVSNKLSDKEIKEKLELTDKVKLIGQKTIQNFEQFILTDFDIDLVGLTKKETDKAFESLKSLEKKKLNVKDDILKNYKIIERLKDDSYKFLESEKTKKNIEDLNKKIEINNNIGERLKNEKDNLEAYLKKSINEFFYTGLINKIYRKIDPHPDYPEIEFDCDFKDKNPRLQIYTKDKVGNKSIPALYFSTAQINILSLSIFLARALKVKNKETGETVKCIFIDDPIQSLDSINILSFIDLFRSIIVSLDRQLIVATQEENFHLLLQKKIPKKLFKSKFIEFETFGKIKK